MKAYVVAKKTPMFPFRRAASTFALGDETVGERLRRQLLRAGFEITELAVLTEVEGPGCIVHDQLVLADATVARLAEHVRRIGTQTCQWSVDVSMMRTVWAHEQKPQLSLLPVWVFGQRLRRDTQVIEVLETRSLFEVHLGLPSAVFGLSNVRTPALHQFAVAINQWPDLLNAATLVARELGAKWHAFFSRFLPTVVLAWAVASPRLVGFFNRTGRRCRIHPSAVLEGCVLGDEVEVGAHAYLRGVVVGSGAVIREGSTIQGAVIGPQSYLVRCDVANAYVGARTVVTTSMLFNSLLGDETFIGGGVGFADYVRQGRDIDLRLPSGVESSGQRFLGCSVGDGCFIGAGLLFGPGEAIASGATVFNPNLIRGVPAEFDQLFAASRSGVTRIPPSFVEGGP